MYELKLAWQMRFQQWNVTHISQGQFHSVEISCICYSDEEMKNKTVYSPSSHDCCHTELKLYTVTEIKGFPYVFLTV